MSKLISIGEALIDFIPMQKGVELKSVSTFQRVAGGAPANVCACVKQLGIDSVMLTKLGKDAFGDYLLDTLGDVGVDISHIKQTTLANTALAFVSLKLDGDRDFSFYRNPSADMLLEPKDIDESLFKSGDILHFCSVDLVDYPVRKAHDKAIEYARKNDVLISFDPNVRLPLWHDHAEYKRIINQYIDLADIVKISDEEIEFITGKTVSNGAINDLFRGHVKLVIYTKGKDGATVYTKQNHYEESGFSINAVDTTGAGDSFIGAFLYQLLERQVTSHDLESINYSSYISFANAVGAMVASKMGAISSMPTKEQVLEFLKQHGLNDRLDQ
jgi:fructokinase